MAADTTKTKIIDLATFRSICMQPNLSSSWQCISKIKTGEEIWQMKHENKQIHTVRITGYWPEVPPELLYDMLHDHEYRKKWDIAMHEGALIQRINGFSEYTYYALNMSPPMPKRDFCLRRSWNANPAQREWAIWSQSVDNAYCPSRKGYVRGTTYCSGYLLYQDKNTSNGVNFVFYVQCDLGSKLPKTLLTWALHTFAPKMMKKMRKDVVDYKKWKDQHNPEYKPWLIGYTSKDPVYQRYIDV